MNQLIKQIRERRESGRVSLCRRGRADSAARLQPERATGGNFPPGVVASYGKPVAVIPVAVHSYFCNHFSGCFFFPASGYRNNTDGKLGALGTEGRAWTSTPVDGSENAWYLEWTSGYVYMNTNNRTVGRSVRCVQASAPVFVS